MISRLGAIAAFLFIALPAGAQVYKCTEGGKAVFQDSPCDGSIVRPTAPPPKAPSPGGSTDALERLSDQDAGTLLFLHLYQNCTRLFPELHGKTAMRYQEWRLKNSAAVARVEASREYKAADQHRDEELAKYLGNPTARKEAQSKCTEMVLQAFEPPPTSVAKTPVEAWNGFIAAVNSGDMQKALGYFMPGSRGRYRQVLDALGPDGMRNAVATFGTLKTDMRVQGDLAFGYLVRNSPSGNAQAFEVSFLRDPRTGGWLIESM